MIIIIIIIIRIIIVLSSLYPSNQGATITNIDSLFVFCVLLFF